MCGFVSLFCRCYANDVVGILSLYRCFAGQLFFRLVDFNYVLSCLIYACFVWFGRLVVVTNVHFSSGLYSILGIYLSCFCLLLFCFNSRLLNAILWILFRCLVPLVKYLPILSIWRCHELFLVKCIPLLSYFCFGTVTVIIFHESMHCHEWRSPLSEI